MIERLRVRIPAEAAGEFSSPESTLCADSYSVFVPPSLLPQWHVKDPGHSSNSASGRLNLNTHAPLTQRSRSGLTMLSKQNIGFYQGHELTRNSSGSTRLQSSQLALPLWTEPGLKSGTNRSPLKKRERKREIVRPPSNSREEVTTTTTP